MKQEKIGSNGRVFTEQFVVGISNIKILSPFRVHLASPVFAMVRQDFHFGEKGFNVFFLEVVRLNHKRI